MIEENRGNDLNPQGESGESLLGNSKRDPLAMDNTLCSYANRAQIELLPGAVRLVFGQQVSPTKCVPVGAVVLTHADFNSMLVQGNQAMVMLRTRPIVANGDPGGIIPPRQ